MNMKGSFYILTAPSNKGKTFMMTNLIEPLLDHAEATVNNSFFNSKTNTQKKLDNESF